ncbi:MAG: arsenosugar biosynthesis radical SAM (seleno)protein ArsS [Bryobacteraceae bacterium]
MITAIPSFESTLEQRGFPVLTKAEITSVQVNVGKICNQACQHCHVEAGPKRTESMSLRTAERVLSLLKSSPGVNTVDITGGAPELNPNFRRLVEESRAQGLHVIDRCNLTILLEPGFEDLPRFLARNQVEVTASLPCYTRDNVDAQRGRGVFDKSIEALQLLNQLGYGIDPALALNLVYNPLGASLPPPEDALEADYKQHLQEEFGIRFNHLFTITNMPIRRFADLLMRTGQQETYMRLLFDRFNEGTLEHLMCRSLVSIGWDGQLYDCDFNQMLDMPVSNPVTVWDIESFDATRFKPIATAHHCFGCTAGAGSSCGGALG